MQSSQLGKEIWESRNMLGCITRAFPAHRFIIVAIHFWFFSQSLTNFKGSHWATSTIKFGKDVHGSETSTTFLHTQKDQITAR